MIQACNKLNGDVCGNVPERQEPVLPRDEILRRFERWLDDVMAKEDPPAGIAEEVWRKLTADEQVGESVETAQADKEVDLFSLWSALINLSQETKLQGRSFKQLYDVLAPLVDLEKHLEANLQALLQPRQESILAAVREAVIRLKSLSEAWNEQNLQNIRRQIQKDHLDVLLDMRDRLVRGRDLAREHLHSLTRQPPRQGFLHRWLRQDDDTRGQLIKAVEAVLEGYNMSLARLDETLASYGVQEIDCHDKQFDPRMMMAVERQDRADVPEGTILEVYRTGYTRDGQVYRTAQVKVARKVDA